MSEAILSEEQMKVLLSYVSKQTGMEFASRLNNWVNKKFFDVYQANGGTDTKTFLDGIVTNIKQKERDELFDSLTVNETMFFRDSKYFDFIEKVMLPKLIEKNQAIKTLSIWIAAGSSGQEIYSILMLILEKFPDLKSWRLNFTSSDICSDVVAKAQKGVYTKHEVSRGMTDDLLNKYFDKLNDNEWQVKAVFRSMINFKRSNLKEDFNYQFTAVDFISCRNVLIYFSDETKKDIVNRLAAKANPSRFLLLGQVDYIALKEYPKGMEYKLEGIFPYLERIS